MNLLELVGKKTYIYGTGKFASRIKEVLQKENIEVLAFLELNKKISSFEQIPVIQSNNFEAVNRTVPVIMGLGNPQADIQSISCILEELQLTLINPIEFAVSAFNSAHSFENYWLTGDLNVYSENIEHIEQARSILSDEKSRKIFDDVINYRKTGDIKYLPERQDVELQYIAPDLPWQDKFANGLDVLDAGAFTGDTYENFLKNNININSWTFLEADPQNFSVISQAFSSEKKDLTLLNVALSNSTKEVNLDRDENQNNGSRISSRGSIKIPSTTIDALFEKKIYNFIKMDIEGSELDSLTAGISSISLFRPILAISTYHLTTHHWEIINYLGSLPVLYDFYLRVHGEQTFDVILYALPSLRR